jgi:predicted N-acetyltransferase YhbS
MTPEPEIEHLFRRPEHLPWVAARIYREFWVGRDGYSPEFFAALLRDASSPDRIPLSLLALVDGAPAGTINLIENDDSARPHLRPWLAALVVEEGFRGRGVGSTLVRRLLGEARRLGEERVYLGSDNPGFYERLGARVLERPPGGIAVLELGTTP